MKDLMVDRIFSWGGVCVVALAIAMILRYFNEKHDREEEQRKQFEFELEKEALENEEKKHEKNKKVKSKSNSHPVGNKNMKNQSKLRLEKSD